MSERSLGLVVGLVVPNALTSFSPSSACSSNEVSGICGDLGDPNMPGWLADTVLLGPGVGTRSRRRRTAANDDDDSISELAESSSTISAISDSVVGESLPVSVWILCLEQ